ncbi:MAG: MBL fold metallo-hydrolase [Nitrospirales bacterium]|nr:MAG: MBL fold metallo-hydrolase [Nitrospirales bacterium]
MGTALKVSFQKNIKLGTQKVKQLLGEDMKFGDFNIFPLTDGRFRLDGGAMFGVVPRVLWEKCCPADDQNRIPLSLTCLLIQAHGKNILVDTGLGLKHDKKFEHMFAVERTASLLDSLKTIGLSSTDIHFVINTHLHFDHAGGNTVLDDQGQTVPTFPKAKYFVQRGEYEDAVHANERTRASYRRENFHPIMHKNQWEFFVGNSELFAGVSVVVTSGHTPHHQSVKVESEGKTAFFLGDVIPTVSHLPLPYIMGYDLSPLQTMETKRWILDSAFEEGWLLMFEHDPQIQMGYVQKDVEGKYFLKSQT